MTAGTFVLGAKMLKKLTPGVNLTNTFALLLLTDLKSAKIQSSRQSFLSFLDLCV